MTVVAVIFTPVVLVYQGWTYWVFRKRIAVHHIPTPAPVADRPMRPTDPWLRQQLAPGAAPARSAVVARRRGRLRAGDRPGLGRRRPGARGRCDGHDARRAGAGAGRGAGGRGRWSVARRRRGGPGRGRGRHVTAPPADDRRRRARRPDRRPPGAVVGARHPRCRGGRALPHPLPAGAGAGHRAAAARPWSSIATQDLLSAVIVLLTLPLVPVFGALVGLATRDRAREQWREMSSLSGPLPRRRARAAHAGGAPPGARAVRRGSRAITDRYRRRLAADPADRLRVLAGPRARGHAVGRPGRGHRRRPAGRWLARAAHRAGRPAAGARGLLAAAPGRGRVPRCRRGRGDLRGRPRPLAEPATSRTVARTALRPSVRRSSSRTCRSPTPAGATRAVARLDAVIPAAGLTVVTGPVRVRQVHPARRPGRAAAALGGIDHRGRRSRSAAPPGSARSPGCRSDRISWRAPSPTTCASADRTRPTTRLWEALRQVALEERVRGPAPAGSTRRLGEDGATLSAGERARLALARIVVADRPWVLLDEPTAHLDELTEQVITDTLVELGRRGAVVVVAHRPALVALADHRLELHDSRDL